MTNQEQTAYNKGSFRERYAMDHGKRTIENWNGKEVWKYKYSASDEYQDANGATYLPSERRWVN